MKPNQHLYHRFIKPSELRAKLALNGLSTEDTRGMVADYNILKTLYWLRKRAAGTWTFRQLSTRMLMREGRDTSLCYMGWGRKKRE